MAEHNRLAIALQGGDVALPDTGRIAVFAPRAGQNLDALPSDRTYIITGFRPDYDYFTARGFDCAVAPDGPYSAAVICLPRAKSLAQGLVAQAASVTDGSIIIDGPKSDGVESLLKACRKRTEVSAPLSKAHGKVFSFAAGPEFADWRAAPAHIADGFVTAPGVFSADGIDPASRLLADTLPPKLGRQVADLGGGWGYLSARALERDSIEALHLVEADHAALDCARQNVSDPRIQFHWQDVADWTPDQLFDSVITNPPFHTGRSADPDLGRAFITAAARILKPGGELWLVANRHLPYEAALALSFGRVEEISGDNRFKVIRAARPSRRRR